VRTQDVAPAAGVVLGAAGTFERLAILFNVSALLMDSLVVAQCMTREPAVMAAAPCHPLPSRR
jgi:hypothetical protein